jgi:RimJ/RimL family protein N-acetyltransferase
LTVITFRPIRPAELSTLHEWLARPHVAEWWQPTLTFAELEEEHAEHFAGISAVKPYFALADGAPIGYIQSYTAMGSGGGWWTEEQDPGVRGIDQFLANAEDLGRGLGSLMVRTFVEELFGDPAVTRVQTDPSPKNGRAIRAYEKAGFRRVAEIDTPDGRALLMICERPAR